MAENRMAAANKARDTFRRGRQAREDELAEKETSAPATVPEKPVRRKTTKTGRINLVIEPDLRQQLRIYCATHDMQMSDVIAESLRCFLADH